MSNSTHLIYSWAHIFIGICYQIVAYNLYLLLRDWRWFADFWRRGNESSSEKKSKVVAAGVSVIILLVCTFALCGFTHLSTAAELILGDATAWILYADTFILVVGAVFSIVTATLLTYIMPGLVLVMNQFELTDEGKVRHLENRLLEVMDMFQESIVTLSPDLFIDRGNAATANFFRESFEGKCIMDFVHEEDQEKLRAAVRFASEGYSPTAQTIEYRLRLLDINSSSSSSGSSTTSGGSGCRSRGSSNAGHSSKRSISSSRLFGSSSINSIEQCDSSYQWVESTVQSRSTMDGLGFELNMITRNIDSRVYRSNEKAKQQEKINAAKLQFISCIAHDIKTPLQTFCFTLDLLQKTPLNSEQHSILQKSEVAADLMKLTVSQTMDISKVVSGVQLFPRKTTVSLNSIIERVKIIMAGYSKQVPIYYEKEDGLFDSIITDEEWIWQMLINYLTNACKYTESGWITLSVRCVASATNGNKSSLSEQQQQQQQLEQQELLLQQLQQQPQKQQLHQQQFLKFSVLDTGIGVDTSKIATLFDAFNQAQEGQSVGTGLGLFGLRTRVVGLGGDCGAYANPQGKGSVFWFTIPYIKDVFITDDVTATMVFPTITSTTAANAGTTSRLVNQPPLFNSGASYAAAMSSGSSRTHSGAAMEMTTLRSNSLSYSSLQQAATAAATTTAAEAISKLRVVVSDDMKSILQMMEQSLRVLGVKDVRCYINGSQALEALMEREADIVFSDLQMPFMSGYEMAQRYRKYEDGALRSAERSKRLHMVLITAHDSEAVGMVSEQAFDTVLQKPINVKQILDVLEKWCSSQSQQMPQKQKLPYLQPQLLPQSKFPQQQLSPQLKQPSQQQFPQVSRTAMIVDDSDSVRKLLAMALKRLNFTEVRCFSNGREALEALKQRHVSLVLTDKNMPLLDGCELARQFRYFEAVAMQNGDRFEAQKLVLLSGDAVETIPADTAELFDAVIEKPLDLKKLKTLVDSMLQ